MCIRDSSDTLHSRVSSPIFQRPTLTRVCCYWPHRSLQKMHLCCNGRVVTFPCLCQGCTDAVCFARPCSNFLGIYCDHRTNVRKGAYLFEIACTVHRVHLQKVFKNYRERHSPSSLGRGTSSPHSTPFSSFGHYNSPHPCTFQNIDTPDCQAISVTRRLSKTLLGDR